MTEFMAAALLMSFTAVGFVLFPIWKKREKEETSEKSRRDNLLAVLREQAADLEKEFKAGDITEDDYEERRSELRCRVLEESRSTEKAEKYGFPLKIAATLMALGIPFAAITTYEFFGMPEATDPAFLKKVAERENLLEKGLSGTEILEAVERLRERVSGHPEDTKAWFLLARTYGRLERFEEAAQALRKLNELLPNNPRIKSDLADMIAASNGKKLNKEAKTLLKEALDIDPAQWKALALLALDAWDTEEYGRAANYWERLLDVMPPELGNPDDLRANIEEARRRARENEGKSPAGKTASAAVGGRLSVAPDIRKLVEAEDVVFVYARPAAGDRMPIVLARIQAGELPVNFVLTDEMRLAVGRISLAKAGEVIVGARISRTGNVMPRSGDYEGETSAPVKIGSMKVDLVIDRILP